MKDRTVVAVGSNVTTLVDGTVGVFSGTSSAAPVVAALAADILSKWPQLSGQQAGDVSRGDLDLRASFIDEDGTLMGMPTGAGALRLGRGARTVMVEVHHRIGVTEGWSLEGYGSLGVTRLKIDAASLVTGATPIVGSRIGVQASGAVPGGLLTLGIAQPLAIEMGAAELTLGTGYDLASRSVLYGVTRASLAGARRVQLTAGYVTRTAMPLRLGVMHDVTDGSVAALVGWHTGF